MHRSLAAAFLLGLVAIGPNIADVEELAFLQTEACEWYGIWLICVGPRNNNQNAKGISSVLHILAWQKRLFDSRSIRPWGFMTWWAKAAGRTRKNHQKTCLLFAASIWDTSPSCLWWHASGCCWWRMHSNSVGNWFRRFFWNHSKSESHLWQECKDVELDGEMDMDEWEV